MKERYRIENELRFGRHGRLIDAHDTILNKRVLCRRVDAVHSNDAEAIDQVNFFSELGALRHPSTVRMIDHHHDPEAGAWYLVSEWVEGEALYDWVAAAKGPIEVVVIERFIERILGWMATWERNCHNFVSIDRSDIAVIYDRDGEIDFKVISGRPSNVHDSLRSFQRLLGWILSQGRDRRLPMPAEIHQQRPDVPLRMVRWVAWLQCPAAEGGPTTVRDAWERYYGGVRIPARPRRRVTKAVIAWTAAAVFLMGAAAALFWAFSASLEDIPETPTVLRASR